MLTDSKTRTALATGGRDGEGSFTKLTLPAFSQENVGDHSQSFISTEVKILFIQIFASIN